MVDCRGEGWRGFYKGLSASLTRVVPATVITLVVYENVSHFMLNKKSTGSNQSYNFDASEQSSMPVAIKNVKNWLRWNFIFVWWTRKMTETWWNKFLLENWHKTLIYNAFRHLYFLCILLVMNAFFQMQKVFKNSANLEEDYLDNEHLFLHWIIKQTVMELQRTVTTFEITVKQFNLIVKILIIAAAMLKEFLRKLFSYFLIKYYLSSLLLINQQQLNIFHLVIVSTGCHFVNSLHTFVEWIEKS